LLLTILDVYSVTLFTVARSTCEIGIRVALGATPSGVLRLVVGRQARAVAVGLVAGLLLSAPASRAIAGLLFGVSRFDGVVHAGTAATVLVVALVAALIPARRALRINPVVALASE
jgi:ABC-type antimicrobial peptide transport system permease subunit